MESHKQIEDAAAEFLAKRDSGDWGEVDQARLSRWMQGSTARRVAILRLEAIWEEAGRVRALGAGLQPGAVPPPGEWGRSPFFNSDNDTYETVPRSEATESEDEPRARAVDVRSETRVTGWNGVSSPRRRGLLAVAAGLLLAVGIGAYLTLIPSGDRYSTPVGGVASVPLQDGSNVILNTASAVRVELTPTARRIRLDKGEAFFEVAKDPRRPFIVQAGSKRVIAVGTKFSVRRTGEEIRVVVTEGRVRIEGVGPDAGRAVRPADILPAGSIASADEAGLLVQEKPLAEVEADLSWRRGYLTFHETPLGDAIVEFNRYNTRPIAIDDPKVASIRISGTFRPTNREAFIRLLQDGFSIHVSIKDDRTVLTGY
ncbi:MAG TPA: FecR domain-containing protein [Steroidobacteraceae bacterium]|nr:FecR domain-containing protein [Steroidobacteraceae bacterium]